MPPPMYVIIPGRAYRRDATDPSHLAQFMQVEALAIDEGITVGDLKGTILYFAQSMWGADRRIRIRPNFFPYTEPSFEFDLSCGVCGGPGCRTCGRRRLAGGGGRGVIPPHPPPPAGPAPPPVPPVPPGPPLPPVASLRPALGAHATRL